MKIIKELVTKWTYKVDSSQLKSASKSLQALRREMAQTTKQGKSKLMQERREVDGLRGAYRRLTDQIRKKNVAQSGSTNAASGFSGGFKSFAALRGLGLNAGAAAGFAAGPMIAGLTGLAGSAMAAGRREQAVEGFTGFVGAKQADELTRQLSQFAERTPLNIQNVRDFATEILAMGQSVDKVIPIMKTIGDATGGNLDRMSRALFNYLEVINKEAADKVDLKQFVRAGIPIYQQLEKQLGVTKDQLSDMVSEGKITGKEVARAFELMTGAGGMFDDRMAKMSKTFIGRLSNLGDALTGLAEETGKIFLPALGDTVQRMKFFLEGIKDGVVWVGKLDGAVKVLGWSLGAIALIFKPILIAFAAFFLLAEDLVGAIQGRDSVIGRLWKAMQWWWAKIGSVVETAKDKVKEFFNEFTSPSAQRAWDWLSKMGSYGWKVMGMVMEHGIDSAGLVQNPMAQGAGGNTFNYNATTQIGLKEGVTPGEAEAMQDRVNGKMRKDMEKQAKPQREN